MSDASATPILRVKQMATKIGSGKTPSGGSETYRDSGVMFLRSQNIHFGGLNLTDVAYIDDVTHREMHGTRVHDGDVLLNITGASLGRVTYFRAGLGEANVNQHVCIIRPRTSTDSRYLAYALSSNICQDQIFGMQVGGNRDGLNFEQVGGLEIPAPRLEEQRRIADFLDAETSRIASLVDSKRAQQSLLAERFEVEMLEAALPSAAESDWRSTRLKYLFSVVRNGIWGDEPTGSDSDVRCVRVADFDRMQFRTHDRSVTFRSVEERALSGRLLRDGDVLLEKSGGGEKSPVGFAITYRGSGRAICSNFVSLLRPKDAYNSRYVGLLMSAMYLAKRNIPYIKQTTGIQNLDAEGYLSQQVRIPPRVEQDRLQRDLDRSMSRIVGLRSVLDRQLALLAEHRQALITAAVTGEFDVTTASGRHLTQGV
ncbi:restriction endonuclease subunit S [Nocardia amikacinitolerans]|uniref:restriction endonuclease subunit S n=1 Tax=Nocardia amikacinitolerans TaxID=756689 RepID=UPI0020A32414|nr:restriction endonuclease subunit S [Nocardia amikacinitolerans]MCP2290627.1 type I restriction enzyme, S subunit [Nocardia amikacinitolerans]